MERINLNTSTKWEPIVGYSRAVKKGPFIHVSGTTSTDENGQIVGVGDSYYQTKKAIQNIEKALEKLGSSLKDVVRTRIFLTNIGDWEIVGKAHDEFFDEIRPATSMIGVRGLVDSNILVEIEAEAIVDE